MIHTKTSLLIIVLISIFSICMTQEPAIYRGYTAAELDESILIWDLTKISTPTLLDDLVDLNLTNLVIRQLGAITFEILQVLSKGGFQTLPNTTYASLSTALSYFERDAAEFNDFFATNFALPVPDITDAADVVNIFFEALDLGTEIQK